MTKFIEKIGVELEGGWDYIPPSEIYGDGSVHVSGCESGEICSPPLDLPDVIEWMRVNYPSHVNSTCGMHFHFSFLNNLSYSRLMERKFYDFFLAEIEKWGKEKEILEVSPFWSRLRGDNPYCRANFQPDIQSIMKGKDSVRYAHLNYCFSFHGTLEVRLFCPFKKVELSISALETTVRIIEDFLSRCKRERNVKIVIEEDDSSIERKEEIVCA